MQFDFVLSSWFLLLTGFGALMYHLGAYLACLPPYRSVVDSDVPGRRWHRIIDWPGNRYDINNHRISITAVIVRGPGFLVCLLGATVFCLGVFLVTLSPREVRLAWRNVFARY